MRETNGGNIRITARAKRQLAHLICDGVDYTRVAEAYLMNIVAVKIEIAAALQIVDVGSLAMGKDVQAGSGERLVQETAFIEIEPFACFRTDVIVCPTPPFGREIEVSF